MTQAISAVDMPTEKMHGIYLGDWPRDSSRETIKDLYESWAETIEDDYAVVGYNGPKGGADALERWLPNKDALILDVACGTGLVGEQLVQRGYTTFDGVDFSPISIQASATRQIYRRLICDEISAHHKLDIEDGMYDAALCVGCFIAGHLSQECFPELIRLVKPGGLIIISMREEYLDTAPEFSDGKLERAMDEYVRGKKWEALAKEPIDKFFSDHPGLAFVFRVL